MLVKPILNKERYRMKKASIFTKLALAVLIAGSISACKQGASTTTTAAAPAASTTTENKEQIVYINSDTLSAKYAYVKDMEKRLTDKGNAAKADLQSKGEAFQREVADYQKNQATMPADQRQTTEQRLQREQQQLQSYQQNASAELQNEQGVEMGKLYDKIAEFVKGYAKEKGYKLVLTYSKSNTSMLYGDPSLDVTADVLKKLNDAYTKDTSK
jgi:outer membrane protein